MYGGINDDILGIDHLSPKSDQNQLLTILIHNQENRLWELKKWSLKGKCFDLLSNSL